MLKSLKETELFLHPGPSAPWLDSIPGLDLSIKESLLEFQQIISRWQNAVLLPIDQLILTISSDLFHSPEELSLSHKIAVFEKQLSLQHPEWDLPYLLDELKSLARNERRSFLGSDDPQFSPESHLGKVIVTTAHKAKGLEWDRVYLMSVNNYNFPSGLSQDRFISEKWFIRDNLNLPAEAISQLEALLPSLSQEYTEGFASRESRFEYVRERLRLLYVSITRAKSDLIITWNSGRTGNSCPAIALEALIAHRKEYQGSVNE
jgi:DNA helicase-2/ATP-dependent DNA helicase PcrA